MKLRVPVMFVNEDADPTVKMGGYVFDMFSDTGIACRVRDPDHVPKFFLADFRKAVGGDLRLEHIDVPPGVTIQPSARTLQNGGNFLIGRAKRARG